jgi:hypothetical protein
MVITHTGFDLGKELMLFREEVLMPWLLKVLNISVGPAVP